MSAPAIADIRAGIAANLTANLPGNIGIFPYRQANPVLPSVQVTGLDEMEASSMQGGSYSLVFIVQAFVATVTDQGGQRLLDEFLYPTGTASIWAALESDRTLAGAALASAVLRNDGTQLLNLPNNIQVLGSSWFVQVEI